MSAYYLETVTVCLSALTSTGTLLKKLTLFKIATWGSGLGGGGCMYFLKNISDYLNKITYTSVAVGGGSE